MKEFPRAITREGRTEKENEEENRMPLKNETTDPRMEEVRKGIMADVADLIEDNADRIAAHLKSTVDQTLTLSFKAKLDFSDSAGSLDTELSYGGQKIKDSRTRTFDDPTQPLLPIGTRPGTGLPETNGDERNGKVGVESEPPWATRLETKGRKTKKKKKG